MTYERIIDEEFIRKNQPSSPEERVMEEILDDEVQGALNRLPEEYREVVIMALAEEMSYKEIASALSIPLGTVMSRLHRGRKLLQAALLEYAQRKGILQRGRSVPTREEH